MNCPPDEALGLDDLKPTRLPGAYKAPAAMGVTQLSYYTVPNASPTHRLQILK